MMNTKKYLPMPQPAHTSLQVARGSVLVAADPFGPEAEPFYELRENLAAQGFDGRTTKSVALLSVDPLEARSRTSANLAAALAQDGRKTLLVDADLGTSQLAAWLGTGHKPGLRELLDGQAHVGPIAMPERTGLYMLPAGKVVNDRKAGNTLHRANFESLMSSWCEEFAFVVVDTPAAQSGRDALLLASCCDIAIVVGRKDHSRIADLRLLLGHLRRASVRIGGVVFDEN